MEFCWIFESSAPFLFPRIVTFHCFPVWLDQSSRFTLKMDSVSFSHLFSPAGFIFQSCVQTVFRSRWLWWRPHVSVLMLNTRAQHISALKAKKDFFFCFFSFISSSTFLVLICLHRKTISCVNWRETMLSNRVWNVACRKCSTSGVGKYYSNNVQTSDMD